MNRAYLLVLPVLVEACAFHAMLHSPALTIPGPGRCACYMGDSSVDMGTRIAIYSRDDVFCRRLSPDGTAAVGREREVIRDVDRGLRLVADVLYFTREADGRRLFSIRLDEDCEPAGPARQVAWLRLPDTGGMPAIAESKGLHFLAPIESTGPFRLIGLDRDGILKGEAILDEEAPEAAALSPLGGRIVVRWLRSGVSEDRPGRTDPARFDLHEARIAVGGFLVTDSRKVGTLRLDRLKEAWGATGDVRVREMLAVPQANRLVLHLEQRLFTERGSRWVSELAVLEPDSGPADDLLPSSFWFGDRWGNPGRISVSEIAKKPVAVWQMADSGDVFLAALAPESGPATRVMAAIPPGIAVDDRGLLAWLGPEKRKQSLTFLSLSFPPVPQRTPVAVSVPGTDVVRIAAGSFRMGCDETSPEECLEDARPGHDVRVSDFDLDRHEVTTADYRRCVDAAVCDVPLALVQPDLCTWNARDARDLPVNCVDWFMAKTFCEWRGARLPTEAEWERAARWTDGRRFPWGQDEPDCRLAVMNEGGHRSGCGEARPSPVCSRPSGNGPDGTCDLAGNLAEWTADWYDASAYAKIVSQDPQGPDRGRYRVVRGGSWLDEDPEQLAAPRRDAYPPVSRTPAIGFRCARSAPTR